MRTLLYFFFIFSQCLAAPPPDIILHQLSLGDKEWIYSGNRLSCKLTNVIPTFGEISFRRDAGQNVQLVVNHWDKNIHYQGTLKGFFKNNTSQLQLPYDKEPMIKSILQGGWVFETDVSKKILFELVRGHSAVLDFFTTTNQIDRIYIHPYHMQTPYDQYKNCLSQLFPFNKEGMSKSILYFDSNEYNLTTSAEFWLNTLIEYLSYLPSSTKIEIRGFSDSSGNEALNLKLADLRAEKVKEYLIKQNVPEKAIRTKVLGSKYPLASNKTKQGRNKNRRVEILIYSI